MLWSKSHLLVGKKASMMAEATVGTIASANHRSQAHGTWNHLSSCRMSSMRPSPSRDSQDNQGGNSSSYKPINLSYRALESRGKEREKQTKTPLIIHHSLLGRKENWNPISEIINRTTQRKVVNVDARNHGESPHTNDMSLPLMAKDVAHLVKKMPNTDKISFMGHAMGGRVGILLALMQPQLIDKLVVVDSSVIVNDNSRRRWSALRQACSSLVKIEDELKKVHGYERLSVANKAIENIIVGKMDRANFLSNLILSEIPEEGSLWRVNMNAYLSHPDMMSEIPEFDSSSIFEGDTLFINGDKSQFVTREHENAIRKLFPNVEFAWLKDCGHLIHVDKQKEFCEKVIPFLEQ